MIAPLPTESGAIDPMRAGAQQQGPWTMRLILFLRVIAVLSLIKGLFHWAIVLGIGEGPDGSFSVNAMPWQAATVFFAVIDLVAGVGLWLGAVWGAVVWLTSAISLAVVSIFFPQIYGGSFLVVMVVVFLLGCYLFLAMQSAREHPH